MPFDSKGFVNTEPLNAPPSSTGVMNQLRFWGMGNSQQRQGLPELQSKMADYQMNSVGNLAKLEDRAIQLRLANDKGLQSLQAGQMEDRSAMAHEQLDMTQPDGLDQLARGLAGAAALGGAAENITGRLGDAFDSDKLKGISKAIGKIPFIGVGRKNAQMQEQFDKTMERLKKEGDQYEEMGIEITDMYKRLELVSSNLDRKIAGMEPQELFNTSVEDLSKLNNIMDGMNEFSANLLNWR